MRLSPTHEHCANIQELRDRIIRCKICRDELDDQAEYPCTCANPDVQTHYTGCRCELCKEESRT